VLINIGSIIRSCVSTITIGNERYETRRAILFARAAGLPLSLSVSLSLQPLSRRERRPKPISLSRTSLPFKYTCDVCPRARCRATAVP